MDAKATVEPIDRLSIYRPILCLHLVWHPNFAKGAELADLLYRKLVRDTEHPGCRGPGLPVFFRSQPADGSDLPIGVEADGAQHTVIVPLVDNEMLADDHWDNYFLGLHAKLDPLRDRFIPVALTPYATKLPEPLKPIQGIRLAAEPQESWGPLLLGRLTHELCRLLLTPTETVTSGTPISPPPVRLFISHAKADGEAAAKALRDYLTSHTALGHFFDVWDIAPGFDFRNELIGNVQRTALVAIRTDAYASRPWCRREILEAKRAGCAIVVVEAMAQGEARSFPYGANTPTLRLLDSTPKSLAHVVDLAVYEVFRQLYFRLNMAALREQLGWQQHATLPAAPELLTVQYLEPHTTGVLYPDPPLGEEELELIGKARPQLQLRTPTQMMSTADMAQPMLTGITVGLSIADSVDLAARGFGAAHLRDAMLEFARYLLVSGAGLAYGGDLRQDGFTRNLFELVDSYKQRQEKACARVANYLAWPHYLKLDADTRAMFKESAQFHLIAPPAETGLTSNAAFETDNPAHRFAASLAITEMRRTMAQSVAARIVLGGKLEGFSGRYPGIVEEAWLTLQTDKPLYVIGAFGGAAAALAVALQGRLPEILTQAYQERSPAFRDLARQYDAHYPNDSERGINYAALCRDLADYGIAGLNNGLDAEENQRLFNTPYLLEMIALVLRGLHRLQQRT